MEKREESLCMRVSRLVTLHVSNIPADVRAYQGCALVFMQQVVEEQ